MLNYYSIIKDSPTYYFYSDDNSNSILFQIERKYKMGKYLFTIKDSQKEDILIFEVRNKLFSDKVSILFQNLKDVITLEGNDKLMVEEKIISIVQNNKAFEKYKSSIVVNEQIAGEINEEHIFPYKKYLIKFYKNESINYYGTILFAITSIHFADGV